jgi:hypothetical protein
MALTLDMIEARYSWRDAEKGKAYMSFYLNSAIPYADAITYFDAVGDALNDMSGCINPEYQIIGRYIEDAYTPPAAGTNVEVMAVFEIETADQEMITISIPAIDPNATFMATNAIDITQTNATIFPFLDMLLDGDGTIAPCDTRGQDIVETAGTTGAYKVIRAVKKHVKSHVTGGGRAG